MSALRHINNRRSGVWYYERRVPLAVIRMPDLWVLHFDQQRLFRRSLETKDEIEALEAAADVAREFEDRVDRALGKVSRSSSSRPLPSSDAYIPTEADFAEIVREIVAEIVDPWSRLSIEADISPSAANQFDAKSHEYLETRGHRLESLRGRGLRLAMPDGSEGADEIAERVNVEKGLNLPENSRIFATLVGYIRQAMVEADEQVADIISGANIVSRSASPLIAEAHAVNERLSQKSPKISEIIDYYLSKGGEKGRLSSSAVADVNLAKREFIAAVGDLPIHRIRKPEVKKFVEAISSKKVGGATKGSIVRAASMGTVEKKMTFLRSPVTFAIDQDLYDGVNPFVGFKIRGYVQGVNKAVLPDKRGMNVGELNLVLQYPWFSGCESDDGRGCHQPGKVLLDDMRFWGPILAMFTGCRAAELGGMMLSDVLIDDPFPHFVIRPNKYRGTKSNVERNVPLLNVLIELGFAEYVERVRSNGGDRLLPDWVSQGQWSDDEKRWSTAKWIKRFNDTLIPRALKSRLPEDARRPVTFHSFRGAFKQMLLSKGVRYQMTDLIIGHTPAKLDRSYLSDRDVAEQWKATSELTYDGLVLPASRKASY